MFVETLKQNRGCLFWNTYSLDVRPRTNKLNYADDHSRIFQCYMKSPIKNIRIVFFGPERQVFEESFCYLVHVKSEIRC